jgi:crotonobetainyl-CoA:carnitine CoA-transferase CaiB-like acyl-CoA transferase
VLNVTSAAASEHAAARDLVASLADGSDNTSDRARVPRVPIRPLGAETPPTLRAAPRLDADAEYVLKSVLDGNDAETPGKRAEVAEK